MAQSGELINTLKKALKLHGKTYLDVAGCLNLTEASVKRLFSQQQFSLERLEQVCQLIGMEISDLVLMMNESEQRLQHLSVEQEREITNDLLLLLITVCVLNRWRMEDILSYYQLSEPECIQKLAQLDRLRIIELLPNNRIKLLVHPNFGWLENGPIQSFFRDKIGQEFFTRRFDQEHEQLLVLNGMFSKSSNAEFQRKLRRLAREFDLINSDDASLPIEQRNGVTVVLAMRDWKYGLFQAMKRSD